MIKWMAFIFAMIALSTSASWRDVESIDARLKTIENRQCILMAVNTPSGIASICAGAQ